MHPLRTHLRTPQLIAGAIMLSVFAYAGALLSISQAWTEPAPDPGTVPLVLSIMSIAMIPAIAVIRKAGLGSLAILAPPPARSTEPVAEADLNAALKTAASRYSVVTILGLAFAESIATYGFASAFITNDSTVFLPNALVALVLMAIQFPRASGLLNLLGEPERATLTRRE